MKEAIVSPCTAWAMKLAARHPNDLTPAERIELNQHLATCPACATISTAYATMEMRIRALPPVAPLASLTLEAVESDLQGVMNQGVMNHAPTNAGQEPAPPVKLLARENKLRPVPRPGPMGLKYRSFPRSLEMGFALACVACLILASLVLFQRGHTSTGGLTPQQIYRQALSGSPTLDDSMSGPGIDNWDQWARCQFIGGAYHVTIQQQHNAALCLDQSSNFTNFAFQVNMTMIKGDGGGVIFRSDDTYSQMYRFSIGTDRSYALSVSSYNGNCKMLAADYSAAINTGLHQTNILTVIVRGSSIYLYINGQYVNQVKDSTALSGEIGVYAIDVTHSADVAFSDVKVWNL